MKNYSFFSLKTEYWSTASGEVKPIHPLSISKREQLRRILNKLYALILQEREQDGEKSFIECYTDNAEVSACIKRCLALHNIVEDDVTPDTLFAFFMPTDATESVGFLAKFNGLEPKEIGLASKAEAETEYYRLIATLWHIESDMLKALEIAENVPADVVMALLKQKARVAKGEEGSKEELKQRAMDIIRSRQQAGAETNDNS